MYGHTCLVTHSAYAPRMPRAHVMRPRRPQHPPTSSGTFYANREALTPQALKYRPYPPTPLVPRVQVDLALEARHLWQFNYNFRRARHVRFPFPIYPLVAPEVLVETFEEGEGISRYVADQQRSAFNSRRARVLAQPSCSPV